MNKLKIFSGNALKLIALVVMVVDHVGYILFPHLDVLRIIGRLSFPIFAFMIAEGAKYTKNKLKYFLLIFICGVIYQTVLYLFVGETFMGIFITFSLAIPVCYALLCFKKTLLVDGFKPVEKVLSGLLFILSVGTVYLINCVITVDYGFFGCITPAIVSLFHFKGKSFSGCDTLPAYEKVKKFDTPLTSVICLAVALVGVWLWGVDITLRHLQPYSFFSLPLLLLYNGKRGKFNLKYFFYIFYPAHLLILYAIGMII